MSDGKGIADQFKAAMESPDCECMACTLRRQLVAHGLALPEGIPIVIAIKRPVNEGPAVPKHPEPKPESKPAPVRPRRRSLLGRLLRWMLRKI